MASTNHPRDSNNNIQPAATDHRPRSHPILRRRTSYCSTMHGHGLGLGSTTAVAPLRASPPTPGTTTAIPALRFPFPLNWVGARTRPLFFFYPLFLSPILA